MSITPEIATRAPPAPRHLAPATKRWWTSIVRDYALESHHLRLLQAVAEAWDRYQQARQIINDEGFTIAGVNGLKAHPALAVERDSRIAFARLLRELDLDCTFPDAPSKRGRTSAASLMVNGDREHA